MPVPFRELAIAFANESHFIYETYLRAKELVNATEATELARAAEAPTVAEQDSGAAVARR